MKKIFLVLSSIIVLILLVAAIMPKDFKIEREVIIKSSKTQVFNYLKMSKNANEWNPWMKKDPNMVQNFTGQDGTVGFINSWSGNKEIGVGEVEIKNIVANERIDIELRFIEPMKATNNAYYIIETVGDNQTKVTWGMTGRTDFPFNIICYFMHGKVAKEFETGLNDLKTILEK